MTLDESLDPARLFNFASDLMETTAKAARREDGPSAAVCAECPPLLLAEGKMAQVLRLERLWSLIARTFRCDMLCGYALPDLEKDKGIFQSICGEHSAVHSR
jgi:hypothetical protein